MNPRLTAQVRIRKDSSVSNSPGLGYMSVQGAITSPRISNISIVSNATSVFTIAAKSTPSYRLEPDGSLNISNVLDFGEDVMCCKYSPNGTLIAVGLNSGTIKLFSADLGQFVSNLADHETNSKRLPVTNMRFPGTKKKSSSNKTLVAVYASGMIKVWLYSSGECLQTMYEDQQLLCLAFNADLSRMATAGSSGVIHIYNTSTMQIVQTCEAGNRPDLMDGHRMRIFALQYHPEEVRQFISGGWDGTIQFWDDTQEHSLRRISGIHICGDGLDIDGPSQMILSASWRTNQAIQIWSYKTGEKIKDIPPDSNPCYYYCCQWVGKNYLIAGGCEHNMLRVVSRVDGNTSSRIVNLPSGVRCVDHYKLGRTRMAIGSGCMLYMAEINNPL